MMIFVSNINSFKTTPGILIPDAVCIIQMRLIRCVTTKEALTNYEPEN